MGQYLNLFQVFKKVFKPVSNPFIKIKPRPFRAGGDGYAKRLAPLPSLLSHHYHWEQAINV